MPDSSELDPEYAKYLRIQSSYEGGPCPVCQERKATEKWAGSDLAASHGWFSWRCEFCVLEEQIAFARQKASELHDLEHELEMLEWAESTFPDVFKFTPLTPTNVIDPKQKGHSED